MSHYRFIPLPNSPQTKSKILDKYVGYNVTVGIKEIRQDPPDLENPRNITYHSGTLELEGKKFHIRKTECRKSLKSSVRINPEQLEIIAVDIG